MDSFEGKAATKKGEGYRSYSVSSMGLYIRGVLFPHPPLDPIGSIPLCSHDAKKLYEGTTSFIA